MAKKINNVNIPKISDFGAVQGVWDFEQEIMKYYNILFELYATRFKWDGLPEEIKRDGGELYLEKTLCSRGHCLFFYDKVLKEYLVHDYTGWGLNFYEQPTNYQVTAVTGYSKQFTRENAVAIYNSPYYTTELNVIRTFATKLALCDMTIMLNVHSQKLPYIIKCTENQRLTLINVFKQINEFQNRVFVDADYDENSIKVYPLNAPFIGNEVYDLKSKYWQEAMKYVGTPTGTNKKERVGQEEQQDAQGEANAMLATALTSRQIACEQINKMFGLNLSVGLREDLKPKEVVEVEKTDGEEKIEKESEVDG